MIMVAALAAPMTVPRLAFAKPGDRHPAGDTLPGSKAARAASQEFIDDAAASNRAEIQTAQFVLQRTRNEALKHFAQKIVHDHSQALSQLGQLAGDEGLELRPGVSSKAAEALDQLKQAHGSTLDSEFLHNQQQDHAEAVAKFRQAQNSTALLAGVRDYARKTLPVLQEHLRMAQQLVATGAKGTHAAR